MGLTSALFALGHPDRGGHGGARCPDEATRPLMVALHDGLRRGCPPRRRWPAAQAGADRSDPAALATAGGFVCYGAG